jgi:hypothetical protein
VLPPGGALVGALPSPSSISWRMASDRDGKRFSKR